MNTCFVYLLIDPWTDDLAPFYIGMSGDPWYRYHVHCHDFCSAPYPMLRMFMAFNVPRSKILTIYRECATRREAFTLEHELVTTTRGLVNRQNAGSRLR